MAYEGEKLLLMSEKIYAKNHDNRKKGVSQATARTGYSKEFIY